MILNAVLLVYQSYRKVPHTSKCTNCVLETLFDAPTHSICQMQRTIVRLYIHDPIINRTRAKKEEKVHTKIEREKKERSLNGLDKHKICTIFQANKSPHAILYTAHTHTHSPSTASNRLSYRLLQLLFGSKCLVTHGTINAHHCMKSECAHTFQMVLLMPGFRIEKSAKINNAVTCLPNSKEIICIISKWDKKIGKGLTAEYPILSQYFSALRNSICFRST